MLQNLIVGPLGRALGLILLFSVFAMVGGGINSIFLQTLDSGVVSSERVDRILAKSATVTSADDVDAVWGDHVDITEGASGEVSECKVGTIADNAAGTYVTPRGTEITVVAGATTTTDAYVRTAPGLHRHRRSIPPAPVCWCSSSSAQWRWGCPSERSYPWSASARRSSSRRSAPAS